MPLDRRDEGRPRHESGEREPAQHRPDDRRRGAGHGRAEHGQHPAAEPRRPGHECCTAQGRDEEEVSARRTEQQRTHREQQRTECHHDDQTDREARPADDIDQGLSETVPAEQCGEVAGVHVLPGRS